MKKLFLIAVMAMFGGGVFARENVIKNSKSATIFGNNKTEVVKSKIESIVNKYKAEKSVSKISLEDVEQCYILIKIYFIADCPDSWFQVAAVLTIKIWDDGCIEFYPWEQQESLICS